MKLIELYTSIKIPSEIKVLSGFNGKVLCHNYQNKPNQVDVGEREVGTIWPDFKVDSSLGYGRAIRPILKVFVDGKEECESEILKKGKSNLMMENTRD